MWGRSPLRWERRTLADGALFVVGIGPGVRQCLTPQAERALVVCDAVVGYRGYLERVKEWVSGELFPFGMGEEEKRCRFAVELAASERRVALVSSGDAGIFGMASLAVEMAKEAGVDVEVIPGMPALSFAASRVGVPVGGDFFLISLSDLLVPWEKIVFDLDRAALSDLPIVLLNPGSSKRRWHLSMAANTILRYRRPDTPVAVVENAFLEGERVLVTTLSGLEGSEFTSMNATVFVGCSRTVVLDGVLVTDRGYRRKGRLFNWVELSEDEPSGIEGRSLGFIKEHLKAHSFGPCELEVVARMVHAVADFSVASLVRFRGDFVEKAVSSLRSGCLLLFDTNMALAGVSSRMANVLGVECRVIPKKSPPPGYTMSAWGMRLSRDLIPDSIVVVGNAPTALVELCRMCGEGVIPLAVVAAPVGFVGTVRAKRLLEQVDVPALVVEGNRGGTPLAVAAVNALLRLAGDAAEGA